MLLREAPRDCQLAPLDRLPLHSALGEGSHWVGIASELVGGGRKLWWAGSGPGSPVLYHQLSFFVLTRV